jgi:hypothetical protein
MYHSRAQLPVKTPFGTPFSRIVLRSSRMPVFGENRAEYPQNKKIAFVNNRFYNL